MTAAAPRPRYLLPAITIGALALAIVAPFLFRGYASGHDFEFHLASWMDAARQARAGILYPRWAELANYGYGEPRFIFYPPASWILGAALSFLFPWPLVPGVFMWLSLTAGGLSMYALAREFLPDTDATAAAVLYAANPYNLLLVYWRSAFAELLAGAIFPLAFLFALRLARAPRRAVLPLAAVVAAVWLMNAPVSVILNYSLALALAALAWRERSWRVLLYGAGALALGLALAAFYVVPAAFEQRWVNISEVLSQGLRYYESFLFTRVADAEHTRFNFLVSKAAVGEIAATALALAGCGTLRRSAARAWRVLVLLAASASVLMLPLSAPAWRYLPKLQYIQFPWRWLLVLGIPFAGLGAAALGRAGRLKSLVWGVALLALALAGYGLTRTDWWDPGGVATFYAEHFRNGAGYEGSDEYGPAGSDHYDLDPEAARAALPRGVAPAAVQVQRWSAQRKRLTVQLRKPATLAVRLLNYPAWRVTVDGRAVAALSGEAGQMLIPVPAGLSQVELRFARTPDRLWGGILSFAALLLLLAIRIFRKPVPPAAKTLSANHDDLAAPRI